MKPTEIKNINAQYEIEQLEDKLKQLVVHLNTQYFVVRGLRLDSFRYTQDGSAPMFNIRLELQLNVNVPLDLPPPVIKYHLREIGWDGAISFDDLAEGKYATYNALICRSEDEDNHETK